MVAKLIVHRQREPRRSPPCAEHWASPRGTNSKTTIPLQLQIMDNQNFQSGDIDTGFLERVIAPEVTAAPHCAPKRTLFRVFG